MSSTNTLRQIGLMVGLVASVAIGAAVVLWLWIPGSESYPGGNATPYNNTEYQNGRPQTAPQRNYSDSNNRFNFLNSGLNDNSKLLSRSGAQLNYTQNLEASYSHRIERLLEPLLGADSIRAQVTADVDFTERERTLETYKRDTRVLQNNKLQENKLEEIVRNREDVDNLESINKHRPEINNYELDKKINRTKSAIGKINKLSITVILDDKLSRGVKGNTIRTPHTEDELNKFENLVKQAIGFNKKRGDIINVISASFKSYRSSGRQIQNNNLVSPTWNQVWLKDLIDKILGTILVLLIIFLVIRPAIKSLINLPTHMSENRIGFNSSGDETRQYHDNGVSGGIDAYEQNMNTASKVVEKDPKLVAQIIKNWVSADVT